MPALIITDCGGGDLSYDVVSDHVRLELDRLRKKYTTTYDYLDAVNEITEEMHTTKGHPDLLASGGVQVGVLEKVSLKFEIKAILYVNHCAL